MSERKAIRSTKAGRVAKTTHAAELPEIGPTIETPPIELEAKVTIVQAAVLHRMLAERLAQRQPIIVNGRQVEEIDTAILQLLTNLWETCRQRGIQCSWDGVSQALRRTAVLIGVDHYLGLPMLEPA